MGQPSVPSPLLPSPPIPVPSAPPMHGGDGGGGGCQVRCAGCRLILTVAPGQTEFVCPTCQLPQMLPPELAIRAQQRPQMMSPLELAAKAPPQQPPMPHVQAHGVDPTKIQLPCIHCKAILNVPHGLSRFACPQCGLDLAYDLPMLDKPPFPPTVPPEEVNEVAVEVEREEDEGGKAGETFTDYRPPKLSIGAPHPDPVVETSSLSAVQPPEPTYNLKIKDDLENSGALSCLQIETLVYACQRHLQHLQNGTRAGFFIGDGAGVGKGRTIAGLIWENWHHGRRKALWISVGSDLKFDARRDLDDVGGMCIEVHALNKLSYAKLDSKSVGVKEGVIFLTYNSLIASSEKGRSRLQQLVQWCGSEFDGLVVFDECHKAKNLVPEAGGQPTRTGEAVLEIQARLPESRVIYCSATGASEPRNMGYMIRLGLWGDGTCFPKFRNILGALDKGGVGALELVAMDMKARGMYVCRTLSYKGAEFEVVEAPLEAKMMDMYKKAAEFWAELRVELLSASAFLPDGKSNASHLWRLYWAGHQRFFRHLCMSAKVPSAVTLSKQALLENKCVVIGLQSTGEARTEDAVTKYGSELDDFVSGPRELLLKFVEENYPLPEKPQSLPGEESVKELQRKRHTASPDVSLKGRVRKIAKYNAASDEESDNDSGKESESDDEFQMCEESDTDSDNESFESDDEFQICEICNTEEERKKLLQCSCCRKLVHPACLVPPMIDALAEKWSCHSCKIKTDEYFQERDAYIAELSKRYEAAVERKFKIMEIIRSLDLPNNPLDDIIDQLGGPSKVAEITGRRGMLVRASSGKGVTYQARNTKDVTMEMVNMHEKQMFMDGKKLISIISEAGSAGVSLQADRRAGNQKRRVHLTLELPWSADRAIQQFGRTHRSNQASAPEYRLLFTNLGGERRFASIVAKRLESLGALTQGDRRAGLSLSAYNYDSAYGKKALMMMYKGIMEQDSLPVLPPGCSSDNPDTIEEFIIKAKAALVSVGIVRDSILVSKDSGKLSGRIVDSDMHDVGRFLNRILGLPPDIQNRLFELFVSILDLLVQNARSEGHLDSGIVGSTWDFGGSEAREREREMENGQVEKWGFRRNEALHAAAEVSIRGILNMIRANLDENDLRPVIPLGHGDPSSFPCFRTSPEAEDAIADALRSAKYNCYAPTVGLLPARRAIADHLSRDLPYQLSPDDVYITSGCTQAIEAVVSVLATPGANILLPKPGYPFYEARGAFDSLEFRHFDLLPEKEWEVNLDTVEALADENTVAMVLINPGNPCGNVYTHQHLKKVAETARKLGILVIADEVYAHITFGSNPFVPMGVFGSIVPVLTVGALSKRWIVPGWRLGWIATTDPNGVLQKIGIVEGMKDYLNITTDPATFIQGAVPQILEKTSEGFFSNIIDILRKGSDICSDIIKEIPGIDCPHKPQGSMYFMVKLNSSLLEDISDDVDFCVKLAKEESVIVMPGTAMGMKNWLRITFAIEPTSLEDGLMRIRSFSQRHAKKK